MISHKKIVFGSFFVCFLFVQFIFFLKFRNFKFQLDTIAENKFSEECSSFEFYPPSMFSPEDYDWFDGIKVEYPEINYNYWGKLIEVDNDYSQRIIDWRNGLAKENGFEQEELNELIKVRDITFNDLEETELFVVYLYKRSWFYEIHSDVVPLDRSSEIELSSLKKDSLMLLTCKDIGKISKEIDQFLVPINFDFDSKPTVYLSNEWYYCQFSSDYRNNVRRISLDLESGEVITDRVDASCPVH